MILKWKKYSAKRRKNRGNHPSSRMRINISRKITMKTVSNTKYDQYGRCSYSWNIAHLKWVSLRYTANICHLRI